MQNRPENRSSPPLKILVTGAYGFLGTTLVPLLREHSPNAILYAVGRQPRGVFSKLPAVHEIGGDLRDQATWNSLPDTFTHVVHLAAHIPWKGERGSEGTVASDNLLPLCHLVGKVAAMPGLRQIIYGSSISVYGKHADEVNETSATEPNTFYGSAKLAGEWVLNPFREKGVRVCHLRFSSIYGYGQHDGTVLPLMINRATRSKELTIFNHGTRRQNFIAKEDAALAVCRAIDKEADGIFNIGSPINSSMRDLAEMVRNTFSSDQLPIRDLPKAEEDSTGFQLNVSKAEHKLEFFARKLLPEGLEIFKRELAQNANAGT